MRHRCSLDNGNFRDLTFKKVRYVDVEIYGYMGVEICGCRDKELQVEMACLGGYWFLHHHGNCTSITMETALKSHIIKSCIFVILSALTINKHKHFKKRKQEKLYYRGCVTFSERQWNMKNFSQNSDHPTHLTCVMRKVQWSHLAPF